MGTILRLDAKKSNYMSLSRSACTSKANFTAFDAASTLSNVCSWEIKRAINMILTHWKLTKQMIGSKLST